VTTPSRTRCSATFRLPSGCRRTIRRERSGRWWTKNSIWLVSDLGDLRTVEPAPGQGRTPNWSPDGQWLAFESNRGSSDQSYAAFIIGRDGAGLRQITGYELDANHPVWSPDGARLAVSGRYRKGQDITGVAIIDVVRKQ
jgi:dipeptidyl aminopeptidase/acylaminoacyl peptidase